MLLCWRQRGWVVAFLLAACAALAADKPTPPRLVTAWPTGPFEVRAQFDRPFSAALARTLVGSALTYRLEQSFDYQLQRGKHRLRIAAVKQEDGGKTLVLTTDPHPRAASYEHGFIIDGAVTAIAYDLSGVEATWDDGRDGATPQWTGRWPTINPATAKVEPFLAKKGRFQLATLVSLPAGTSTVRIEATGPIEATLGGEEPLATPSNPAHGLAVFRVESTNEPTLLTLIIPTGNSSGKPVSARLTTSGKDGVATEVPAQRYLLPWTPPEPPPAPPLENVPDLKGGDPVKGRTVFHSPEAKCASCHKVGGEGGDVGPDLSALAGADRLEVYRDIFAPSARIHPEYVSYTLALKDGRILVGTVHAEGADRLRVTDTEAKSTIVARDEVENLRASATSIMPVGLAGVIGDARLRDLIAFLTKPSPPSRVED